MLPTMKFINTINLDVCRQSWNINEKEGCSDETKSVFLKHIFKCPSWLCTYSALWLLHGWYRRCNMAKSFTLHAISYRVVENVTVIPGVDMETVIMFRQKLQHTVVLPPKGFLAQQKVVCVGVSLYLCRSVGYCSGQPMH